MRILFILLVIFLSDAAVAQAPYSVVISEIMPDPTPVVGLPDAEWIELKNTTASTINLQGWRIAKPASQSGAMPLYLLKPDSAVIITSSGNATALSAFGPVISVTSFPALTNTGDVLILKNATGAVVHAISYTDNWYQNDLKKNGGWSLEMIDTKNPCTGAGNWKASIDAKGGTPSKPNSVAAQNPDAIAPKLLRAYAPDSISIVLSFNENLDSTKAAVVSSYTISDGIGAPVTALPQQPLFDKVLLKLNGSNRLQRNKVYTITVNSITDCSGNAIGTTNAAKVGLFEHLDSLDIVVNEILFNPKANGVDFVEIYNRSNQIIDLKNAYIANRNTIGALGSITQLSTDGYLFFPGEYLALTTDANNIKANYIAQNPEAFIELASMPSFNDDAGNAIILNEQGNIVDALAYDEKWHFPLISNAEGVSLERIDANAATQNSSNWHSASSSVGYATPTYKNSQAMAATEPKGEVSITPKVFSPDNDGYDDFLTINYSFPQSGSVANITIFDASGRPVRYLQKNALNGRTGFYRWDGLGEKMQKLPVGIYVVYTEVFNLEGKTKKFKHTVVLARKN